jgi:hypothetical protein
MMTHTVAPGDFIIDGQRRDNCIVTIVIAVDDEHVTLLDVESSSKSKRTVVNKIDRYAYDCWLDVTQVQRIA